LGQSAIGETRWVGGKEGRKGTKTESWGLPKTIEITEEGRNVQRGVTNLSGERRKVD